MINSQSSLLANPINRTKTEAKDMDRLMVTPKKFRNERKLSNMSHSSSQASSQKKDSRQPASSPIY